MIYSPAFNLKGKKKIWTSPSTKVTPFALVKTLMNAPIAPWKILSYFINAGTDDILDALGPSGRSELAGHRLLQNYLEGTTGSGRTQFINSLISADEQNVVTAHLYVTVSSRCCSALEAPPHLRAAIMDLSVHRPTLSAIRRALRCWSTAGSSIEFVKAVRARKTVPRLFGVRWNSRSVGCGRRRARPTDWRQYRRIE